MSSKITLNKPTDDELSGAVAEHVAKLPRVGPEWGKGPKYWYKIRDAHDGGNLMDTVPPYATSANAALPLLENEKKRGMWVQIKDHTNGIDCGKRDWLVIISDYDDCCDPYEGDPGYPKPGSRLYCEGVDPVFAKAVCIAVLKAHGVEVTP